MYVQTTKSHLCNGWCYKSVHLLNEWCGGVYKVTHTHVHTAENSLDHRSRDLSRAHTVGPGKKPEIN